MKREYFARAKPRAFQEIAGGDFEKNKSSMIPLDQRRGSGKQRSCLEVGGLPETHSVTEKDLKCVRGGGLNAVPPATPLS